VKTDVSCHGGNNGSITLTVNGGTGSYSYNWGNGITTPNRTNLAASTYIVTVTDANNCTGTHSSTITQPAALIANIAKTDVTCHGQSNGSIILTVNGGTTPYTFAWSNGANSQNINSVPANTYTATITDANACTAIASAVVNQPAALSASAAVTNVTCHGGQDGSINLTVNGGTGSYSYLWNNGSTTEDISSVQAGNYSVSVTDANGCVFVSTASIGQPDPLMINNTVTNIACAGYSNGSISANVSGGTSPYTFVWNNAANTATIATLSQVIIR
jgi:hypothetical protein